MPNKKKILVVGDVMIDRYVHVKTERQAPEAPIPVWDEVSVEHRLGGAANVAHNVAALGGDEVEVFLAGLVEPKYKKMISSFGINTILCTGEETMIKNRYVDENMKYLLRADNIKKFTKKTFYGLHKCLEHFLPGHEFDAVVYSDYDKGTIDEKVVELIRKITNPKIVTVDSKCTDLSMYRGSTILKINEFEHANQISKAPYKSVEQLFKYVVVTHGSKGSELRENVAQYGTDRSYATTAEMFVGESVKATDVTGCGDTHAAALTFSLVKNSDVRLAVKFANACARNVVQKFGTSVSDVNLVNTVL